MLQYVAVPQKGKLIGKNFATDVSTMTALEINCPYAKTVISPLRSYGISSS